MLKKTKIRRSEILNMELIEFLLRWFNCDIINYWYWEIIPNIRDSIEEVWMNYHGISIEEVWMNYHGISIGKWEKSYSKAIINNNVRGIEILDLGNRWYEFYDFFFSWNYSIVLLLNICAGK